MSKTSNQYKFQLTYNNDDDKKTINISIIALYRNKTHDWRPLPDFSISNNKIRDQYLLHKDLLYEYIVTKKYDVIISKCIYKNIKNIIFTDFVPMNTEEEKNYKKILYQVLENNN